MKLPYFAFMMLFVIVLAACVPAPAVTPTAAPGSGSSIIQLPTEIPSPTPAQPRTSTARPEPTAYPNPPPPPASGQSTRLRDYRLRSILMVNTQIGWSTASGVSGGDIRVFRTQDGGAEWHNVSPSEDDFRGSFFLDSETAWVWSWEGTPVWHTQDGGRSWEIVGDLGMLAVPVFVDGLHGWKMIVEIGGMVTTNAHILSFATTQDGGQSWQETGQPPGGGYTSLTYLDSQIAWGVFGSSIVSDYGLPDLRVPYSFVATFDGGVNWTSHRVPLPDEAKVVDDPMGTFLDAGNCRFALPRIPSRAIWKFAVACEHASWMYTTANQGKTWIISSMPASISPRIEFVSPTTGWLFAYDYFNQPGKLYRTFDGGASWELIKRTGWTSVILSFLDEQTGWAVVSDCWPVGSCSWYNEDTTLVKTTDGGETWHEIETQFLP